MLFIEIKRAAKICRPEKTDSRLAAASLIICLFVKIDKEVWHGKAVAALSMYDCEG